MPTWEPLKRRTTAPQSSLHCAPHGEAEKVQAPRDHRLCGDVGSAPSSSIRWSRSEVCLEAPDGAIGIIAEPHEHGRFTQALRAHIGFTTKGRAMFVSRIDVSFFSSTRHASPPLKSPSRDATQNRLTPNSQDRAKYSDRVATSETSRESSWTQADTRAESTA
jgi:hypothetical protein